MVWDSGKGVFNLTSSSGIPTNSIMTSLDKSVPVPSFYDMTPFLDASLSYPYSDIIYPSYSPTSTDSELSLIFLTKMYAYPISWFDRLCLLALLGQTRTALSCLFSFFFGGEILGADCLEWLPWWGGRIYFVCLKDNDLEIPIMKKHDISCSITFRTFQNHVPFF